MKLKVNGEYHNNPAQLHFAGPGVIEIDDWKAEFLLRDAPGNFERHVEPEAVEISDLKFESDDEPAEDAGKGLDEPTKDKQVKTAPKKK